MPEESPFSEYEVGDYVVLAPEQSDAHRVRKPDGVVIGVPCEDSTQLLTSEALSDFLANPPAPIPTVEQIWADFLAGTITDVPTGIALKANRSAKADFADMFTLITAAIARGLITEETEQSIWDAANNEHVLPAGDILDLIVRYGFAWQSAFNELAP